MARTTQSQPRSTQRRQANNHSQSQSQIQGRSQQHSQSQRHRQRDEDDEEDDEEDGEEEQDEEKEGNHDVTKRKINALVRLALFNECKRVPLRRDEINKKVLGNNTRQFNEIFKSANERLRKVFGMELVELMSRTEREKELNAIELTQAEENATGLKKKAAAAGSKSYILRSTLHPNLIEYSSRTLEKLFEDEIPEDEPEDEDKPLRTYGSILSWSSSDQLGAIGITYVILALVLLSGRVMSDMEMRKHLRSLRLDSGPSVQFSQTNTHGNMTIDAFLNLLIRQGYLDKVKVSVGAPRATQGAKRSRASATQPDNDTGVSYEWRWGSRAQSEVGEKAIARFVGEFMVERTLRERQIAAMEDDEDDEGSDVRRNQSVVEPQAEKERMLKVMLEGISKAVGGNLGDVR